MNARQRERQKQRRLAHQEKTRPQLVATGEQMALAPEKAGGAPPKPSRHRTLSKRLVRSAGRKVRPRKAWWET